ncbi:hypothetical protein [Microvirga pudoricolor]|uniref:hypothetical protein n=1 Tax=Microvirga pudoricolor TaxID=2778729 RepID=UPI00194DF9B8|nr:hypothetical protein [Microvirga pudoricolor]MBM6596391.1 hypothetical protein [Microvirga pudoricolor]
MTKEPGRHFTTSVTFFDAQALEVKDYAYCQANQLTHFVVCLLSFICDRLLDMRAAFLGNYLAGAVTRSTAKVRLGHVPDIEAPAGELI